MLKKFSWGLVLTGLVLWLAPFGHAQFTTPSVNISNSATDSKFPKIAYIEGTGNVFVVWIETIGTDDRLYFSKSTDSGGSWSTPAQLTSSGEILGDSSALADYYAYSLVVADPYIHIVFQWRADASSDWEIWHKRSTDLGDSWELSVQLTNNTTPSQYPDVEARGAYVHVIYQDSWPGNMEIMYKRITNYGAGTVDQTRRLSFSSTSSYYPRIAVSSSGMSVNIVYEEETTPGVMNIMHKVIRDYGTGTYDTNQLTFAASSPDWNGLPDIVASTGANSEYFYIVYQALWPGNREIIYKRFDNWGYAPFSVYTARLTYSGSESRSNSVSFDGVSNYVHVSYQDNWPGNYEIMYKKLSNYGGDGFSTQRVSWGTGDSAASTVAASGASAYVVWMDDSSGNYEILLKIGS